MYRVSASHVLYYTLSTLFGSLPLTHFIAKLTFSALVLLTEHLLVALTFAPPPLPLPPSLSITLATTAALICLS